MEPVPAPGTLHGETTYERLCEEIRSGKLPPGSRLHLFSDGAFEIITADDRQLTIGDFLPVLAAPPQPGLPEPERLWRAVRNASRPGPLDDDVSLLTLDFA